MDDDVKTCMKKTNDSATYVQTARTGVKQIFERYNSYIESKRTSDATLRSVQKIYEELLFAATNDEDLFQDSMTVLSVAADILLANQEIVNHLRGRVEKLCIPFRIGTGLRTVETEIEQLTTKCRGKKSCLRNFSQLSTMARKVAAMEQVLEEQVWEREQDDSVGKRADNGAVRKANPQNKRPVQQAENKRQSGQTAKDSNKSKRYKKEGMEVLRSTDLEVQGDRTVGREGRTDDYNDVVTMDSGTPEEGKSTLRAKRIESTKHGALSAKNNCLEGESSDHSDGGDGDEDFVPTKRKSSKNRAKKAEVAAKNIAQCADGRNAVRGRGNKLKSAAKNKDRK